jgi:hypothetical protein
MGCPALADASLRTVALLATRPCRYSIILPLGRRHTSPEVPQRVSGGLFIRSSTNHHECSLILYLQTEHVSFPRLESLR